MRWNGAGEELRLELCISETYELVCVCARTESYCSEKINERGEVFKEKDYTICTKNFHAMGQLKLKTCSLCSNVFQSTNCQIFVLAIHVCFLVTR